MTVPIPKLAGVCGWPAHHSLSPLMHTYWIRNMDIPGAYVPFAVRPDDAPRAFGTLKHTSISGVNVTAPLKALAFEAADEVTPDAEKLGVANCLYKKGGKLIAHNTDMEGFAVPLLKNFGPKKKLKSDTNLPSIYNVAWRHRQMSIPSAGLLINASSAGMKGFEDLDVELRMAMPGSFIYDLVYNPLATGFLKQANRYELPFIGHPLSSSLANYRRKI